MVQRFFFVQNTSFPIGKNQIHLMVEKMEQ